MKILFSSALAVCMLTACNGSRSTNTNSVLNQKDSTKETADNAMSNNVLSNNGLPMSSSQEVPANSSTATGTMNVSYNKDNHLLKYTVNWSGLTGIPTMAHIHGPAAKGVSAGVKHDLTGVLVKAISGSFTDSVTVDNQMIKEDSLINGFYYINIHTPANPSGEIRGQIVF